MARRVSLPLFLLGAALWPAARAESPDGGVPLCGGDPAMVPIPAGKVFRGCDPDAGVTEDERYAFATYCTGTFEARQDAFEVDRDEVTEGAYARCIAAGGCTPTDVTHLSEAANVPVERVTFEQARAYCRQRRADVPTVAMFERAARGDDDRRYAWGNAAPTCELAAYKGCSEWLEAVGSHALGQSAFGVNDLTGNAQEWLRTDDGRAVFAMGSASRDRSFLPLGIHHAEAGALWQLGFRCARSCTWPAALALTRPRPPLDVAPAPRRKEPVDPLSRLQREALERWVRAQGPGYELLFAEPAPNDLLSLHERRTRGRTCLDGWRELELTERAGTLEVTGERAAADCCDGKDCTRAPLDWVYHLELVLSEKSFGAIRALIHPREGLRVSHTAYLPEGPREQTATLRSDLAELPLLRMLPLNSRWTTCPARFDEAGKATCRIFSAGIAGTIDLRRTRGRVHVVRIEISEH